MTTGDVVYSLRFSLIKILPEPGFDLGSTAGESCVLTARLHMLYCISIQLNYSASTRPALIIIFFYSLELKCRPIYLMWYGMVLCDYVVGCGMV